VWKRSSSFGSSRVKAAALAVVVEVKAVLISQELGRRPLFTKASPDGLDEAHLANDIQAFRATSE
jgi:hypothetical protein